MFRRKRPTPPEGPRRRRGQMPRSLWIWLLAMVGMGTVLFLLIRFLIIPFLVFIGGGGA